MKFLYPLLLVVLPVTTLANDALAGYSNPSQHVQVTTVALARLHQDGHRVVLRGTLLHALGKERYRFGDASASIDVEIDDDDLPHGVVGTGVMVELHGEIDTHRYKPTDVDVSHVRIITSGA